MVHRATGPGKVEVDQSYSGPGMAKALLYNFDIDGADIKPEHERYLRATALPLLRDNRGAIWMQGSASRSGADAYNLRLSRRRVSNVESVLLRSGITPRQVQSDAVGEALAFGHAREDERDRAVALVILPYARPVPPPQNVPDRPATNTRFKIRMLMNLNASVVAGIDYSVFQIWDQRLATAASTIILPQAYRPDLSTALGFQPRWRGPGMIWLRLGQSRQINSVAPPALRLVGADLGLTTSSIS